MTPVELTNFTVWGRQWFDDGWEGLRALCERHGLAGIELLGSGATADSAPPPELITGVHLRSLGNWLPLAGVQIVEFGHGASRYAQVGSYEELVQARANELEHIAQFEPEYVVWHGSYAPFPQAFGGAEQITGDQFLGLFSQLVRDVLERYTPKYRVFFENTFGVGIDPELPRDIAGFLGELSDLPVGLCIDIGHYLNRHREYGSAPEACAQLGRIARALADERVRAGLMHLHWTPPELVPADAWDTAESLALEGEWTPETIDQISEFFARCDQHRPMAGECVGEMVRAFAPEFLVHEMGAMSLAEHDEFLGIQTAAVRGK